MAVGAGRTSLKSLFKQGPGDHVWPRGNLREAQTVVNTIIYYHSVAEGVMT